MKNPTTGEWVDAVTYQRIGENTLFVREKDDFYSKFTKI